MTIDEFIETIEQDYLEDALERLTANPKDLVMVYLSSKEYQRAKLVRSSTMAEPEEQEKDIKIVIKG